MRAQVSQLSVYWGPGGKGTSPPNMFFSFLFILGLFLCTYGIINLLPGGQNGGRLLSLHRLLAARGHTGHSPPEHVRLPGLYLQQPG